jgi:hypothetical protein
LGDSGAADDHGQGQVLREIEQFRSRYPRLGARLFIAYDRVAFAGVEDRNVRLTFDANIRFRPGVPRPGGKSWTAGILEPGKMVMEVKTSGAIPLWLCRALSERVIFPAGFSKYGKCCAALLRKEYTSA